MKFMFYKNLSKIKLSFHKGIYNRFKNNNFEYTTLMSKLNNASCKLKIMDYNSNDSSEANLIFGPKMRFGTVSIPHFKKKKKGGEDSFYASDKILVITDGVGGWNQVGIDPSEYSREVCKNIQELFTKFSKIDSKTPKNLLVQSAKNIKLKGSSTCTVIVFDDKKRKIYVSYIGDSCYLLIKCMKGKLVPFFKSKEQSHNFNIPFQIGVEGDNPDSAVSMTHDVGNHDIIIVGSDGLWDNLEIDQIVTILYKYINGSKLNTDDSAKALANEAEILSKDKGYLSPFSKKAREHNFPYTGGKPDDITIIVAQINLDL